MDKSLIEYIESLIPQNYPDGKKLLDEGRRIAKNIHIPRTKFLEKHNCKSYLEYRKQRLKDGKQTWQILLGLATLEDELDGIRKIYEFGEQTGMEISGVQSIPAMKTGLPHDYWEKAPKQTSYELREPEEWKAHTDAAPLQVAWQDFHLSCPAALQTTINALEAGSDRVGCVSTFIWDYPGYHDEKERLSDMVRALGVLSSVKERDIDAVTYAEDGMPGYFLDVASWVGYMMLENYVVADLCQANFGVSFGGLLTEIPLRLGFALAMHKLFSTPEHPALVYFNGGTIDQTEKFINGNYGTGVQEMLAEVLFNLHYQTPTIISPVAITECLRTPSLEELLDISAAGIRAEQKAAQWLPLMDFSSIEEISERLIAVGTDFYQNVLLAFREAGIDTEDPLQILAVLKRFNPVRFEQCFHPSTQDGQPFHPVFPSQLGRETMQTKDRIVARLREAGLDVTGKRVVCASADGHSYGLMMVDAVYRELGATVMNGGVDVEPAVLLDLADEDGSNIICVSTHCGQCLSYAKTLVTLAKLREKTYCIVMGGMFTALLPGEKLPVDVRAEITKTGVFACNDFEKQIQYIQAFRCE